MQSVPWTNPLPFSRESLGQRVRPYLSMQRPDSWQIGNPSGQQLPLQQFRLTGHMAVEPGHVPLAGDCFPVSTAWEKEARRRRTTTTRGNVDLGVILIGEGVGEGW